MRHMRRNWRIYEQMLAAKFALLLCPPQNSSKAREVKLSFNGVWWIRGDGGYTDAAIYLAKLLKTRFGLTYRQVEVLLKAICSVLNLHLPIPDHSTIARRAKKMPVIPLPPGPITLKVDHGGVFVEQSANGHVNIALDPETGNIHVY